MSDILDAHGAGSRAGGPSFSLRNRMMRVAWGVTWFFLARWTPPPLHRWRRFLLRAFGARMASNARVYGSTKIWLPANLTMETNALLGPNVNCYNQGRITICEHAIVSQFTHLVASTHDADDEHFQLLVRPISIGAHAWVAASAFVGPGVTIGEGAVLGAFAATFRDLAPWTIHGGNPAKFIRKRRRYIAEGPF